MKFKVTFKTLDAEQLAGVKSYGYSELQQVEEVEADDAEQAIEAVQDNITDVATTQNGCRLFDSEIDDAEVSADIILVDLLTDKILAGYYDFNATE